MDLKRFGTLLTPSLTSAGAVGGVSLLTLAGATWSYNVGSGALYNYLFGPNSSTELIRSSRSTISAFSNTIFGNPTLNKVMYFAFWVLVGLLVYSLLFIIIRGTVEAARDVEEATYANEDKLAFLRSFGMRLGTRLIVAVVWLIYSIFFFKTLFPFVILAAKVGAGHLPALAGWLYGLLGLLAIALGLHLHVILLRLLFLRARLYDSGEDSSEK